MQPSLSRAIPAGILGFLGGALLALIIRGLQGLTPTWAVGPGMVLGAFIGAGFFVWGMGGFDPRMSVHGEAHEEETHEEPKPTELLGGTIWQLTTLLIGFILVLAAIAWLPTGPTLTITADPAASRTGIGYFDLNLFGIEIPQVSELVIFIGFFIIMMLSLFILAGALGAGFHSLARGVANAQAVQHTPLQHQLFELPSGQVAVEAEPEAPAAPRSFSEPVANILFFAILVVGFLVIYNVIMPFIINNVLGDIIQILDDTRFCFSIAGALALAAGIARPSNILTPAAVYLAIAAVLYPIFYYAAIGLVIASPEIVRFTASVVNALLIPLLILRPKFVTFLIGRGARIAANVLRWVGTVR